MICIGYNKAVISYYMRHASAFIHGMKLVLQVCHVKVRMTGELLDQLNVGYIQLSMPFCAAM